MSRERAAVPADELELARRAGAGDGRAFAELYDRYADRAYNLCLRIAGSEEDAADATQEAFTSVLRRLPELRDRELAFGSYLFTSARNACYDLMEKRRRAEPSDELPQSAAPVGAGPGGGAAPDPGDPEEDPERGVLLAAQQDEVRAANATLPERQREVLALRELEELSYDEIAELLGMNRNSVAQLISRARINLRDALRGTAFASVAASTRDCERALPLVSARADGQLEPGGEEARWLAAHLTACDTCAVGAEAMAEAGASYRAWVPVAAAPILFRETMARAAELVGADWSDVIAERQAGSPGGAGAGAGSVAAAGDPARAASGGGGAGRRRLAAVLAALVAGLLLLGVLAAGAGDPDPPPVEPAALETVADETAPATTAGDGEPRRKGRKPKRKGTETTVAAEEPAATADAPLSTQGAGDAQEPVRAEPRRRPVREQPADRREPRQPATTPTVPEPAPEPETVPETTPEPPPTKEPDPPVTTPPECRSASGAPIPCPPPPPPPPPCTPTTGGPSCPPPTIP